MMLTPDAHVPGVLRAVVDTVGGGHLLLVLADPADRVELYVEGPDLWRLQLDAAGVDALLQALGEARGQMRLAELQAGA